MPAEASNTNMWYHGRSRNKPTTIIVRCKPFMFAYHIFWGIWVIQKWLLPQTSWKLTSYTIFGFTPFSYTNSSATIGVPQSSKSWSSSIFGSTPFFDTVPRTPWSHMGISNQGKPSHMEVHNEGHTTNSGHEILICKWSGWMSISANTRWPKSIIVDPKTFINEPGF